MPNKKLLLLFICCLFLKFILFDLIWCLDTTFKSFSFPQTYLVKFFVASLLATPLLFIRSRWYVVVVSTLLDVLLIVNLMYFRTYYTAIPWDNYFLVGNLADFKASVYDSLRWIDLGFPLLSIGLLVLYRKADLSTLRTARSKSFRFLGLCIAIPFILTTGLVLFQGGYKKAYESLLIHSQTCGTPMYTIVGSLYYEHLQEKLVYTPEIKRQIEQWLAERSPHKALPFQIEARENCIVILCESLESWVLEKNIEGKEITPNINKFLKEPNTVYAPYVQTQAKGARSIDGQLMLHTGLLPIANGAYSARFPHNTYPSLEKAFKMKFTDGKAYCMTVDKKVVWNQGVVALVFGYDRLFDKPFFTQDEATGPMKKLGDLSFMRQCFNMLQTEELFATNGHTLVQCVTYSGHAPFIIPEPSKRISFTKSIPQMMNDYMVVANYTDHAIGEFINNLRSQKKFENTMFVITGDHEGLASNREALCHTPAGKNMISPNQFTPFIIINAPIGLRYEKVMGQIDMYPTLLNLLSADHYAWTGLGESIFAPEKKGFAITPLLEVIGDTTQASAKEIEHAKEAWEISDLIIRTNYFEK